MLIVALEAKRETKMETKKPLAGVALADKTIAEPFVQGEVVLAKEEEEVMMSGF
jgi:hypothetical protein